MQLASERTSLYQEAILLFSLNFLDALLTILWVRNGAAEEANTLMSKLLEMGDHTFLGVKLAIGTFAAIVFIFGGDGKFARYGISFAIAIYLSLLGIHIITGVHAFGLISGSDLENLKQGLAIFAAMFTA